MVLKKYIGKLKSEEEEDEQDEQNKIETEIDKFTLLDVLKNDRRYRAIKHIYHIEGGTNLATLSEEIAAKENDKPIDLITSKERKAAYVTLYQNHLPVLDECNVINWTKRTGRVEKGEELEAAVAVVQCVEATIKD